MTSQTADFQHFRAALGSFATGVTIVTTWDMSGDRAGRDVGLTANSFNSVSLDPPMILWSIGKNSLSLPAFAAAEFFAVHILATDQQALSDRFAKRGIDKFGGLDLERGPGNVPLLKGCAARFTCRTAYRYEGGDHDIFVGEVVEFDHFAAAPLIFHSGKYAGLSSAKQAAASGDGGFAGSFLGFLLPRVHYALFETIKTELRRLGIGLDDYFALSALGARSLSIGEIAQLGQFYDCAFDQDNAARLKARELIDCPDIADDDTRLHLTSQGRTLMLQLMAIGKDAEETLLERIAPDEVQGLKSLLRRLANETPSVAFEKRQQS